MSRKLKQIIDGFISDTALPTLAKKGLMMELESYFQSACLSQVNASIEDLEKNYAGKDLAEIKNILLSGKRPTLK